MGLSCCKEASDDRNWDMCGPPLLRPPLPSAVDAYSQCRIQVPRVADPNLVDQLVMDMLRLIASFVDNGEEAPESLSRLHAIADTEDGWIQVVSSMVNVIPLDDPFGPSAITILFDDCPLPSREAVIRVTELFQLSTERASAPTMDIRVERNICAVLGCIAEKLAGPNSVAILTEDTLNYLFTFLVSARDPRIVLFALIALEKFAHTTENKLTIKARIDQAVDNPLLALERCINCNDFMWRQVGFCANWMLDNIFIVEGRKLSYELADMSQINVVLNTHDVSEYLKISCDGLEARCDSFSFESVRCTFQVDHGCWYYECVIITPGVMQIGWATKNSHFLNHEGYGIGDDLFSISYDGCRKLMWFKAQPTSIRAASWQPGDILGCLIDIERREVIFSINGKRLPHCWEIFETNRFGFFAAASFMAFQQCRFNFGHVAFRFPPTDRTYTCFNDHGQLTVEQKKVIPRRLYLEKLRNSSVKENACTLCFDDVACCVLEPCSHRGFCSLCTSQLKECPMCRAEIKSVRPDLA